MICIFISLLKIVVTKPVVSVHFFLALQPFWRVFGSYFVPFLQEKPKKYVKARKATELFFFLNGPAAVASSSSAHSLGMWAVWTSIAEKCIDVHGKKLVSLTFLHPCW